MGKTSGVPHRNEELDAMTVDELTAELDRAHTRLRIAPSAKSAKQWKQRIHWLESVIARRE